MSPTSHAERPTTSADRASSPGLAQRLSRYGAPSLIAAAVVAAVGINLVLWLAGVVAGGSFEFTDGDETFSAAPGGVVLFTAVPLAVGMTLTAMLARRWITTIRIGQVIGSILAVGTIAMTLDADFDTASTVTLSLTHVTLAPVLVIGLEAIRRRLVRSRR